MLALLLLLAVSTPATCHANGPLPDHRCTPGVRSHKVVPSNVQRTICKPGYAKSVRPPLSYTEPLKRVQIRQYGYADKRLSSYEEDHLIPISLGGSPTSPRNLWPEPKASALLKDRAEYFAHREVCRGNAILRALQYLFATDWRLVK